MFALWSPSLYTSESIVTYSIVLIHNTVLETH